MKKQASASKPAKAARQKGGAAESTEAVLDGIVGEGAELHLQLPGFEGPFDLLLHLIEEHELDILDIPIAFVTERYLQYLALMQELNIDVASDYLVMAATLAHLKSRMLLPTPPADDDADGEEGEQDPRAELIRRLLEYQKYKQAAEQLANRSVLGRDTFTRGALPEIVEGPAPLAPVGVFKLLEAFQRILARAKTVIDHQIEFERLSITDRINQLVDRLREFGTLSFDALFEGQRTRAELIVTFLALLEMTRLRLTNVHQEHALAPIVIELAVSDGEQAIDSEAADYLNTDAAPVQGAAEESREAQAEIIASDATLDDPLEDAAPVDAGMRAGSATAPETTDDEPAIERPEQMQESDPGAVSETQSQSEGLELGDADADSAKDLRGESERLLRGQGEPRAASTEGNDVANTESGSEKESE